MRFGGALSHGAHFWGAWRPEIKSFCPSEYAFLFRRLRVLSRRFVLPGGFPQQVDRRTIPQQACRPELCTPQPWSAQPRSSFNDFLIFAPLAATTIA